VYVKKEQVVEKLQIVSKTSETLQQEITSINAQNAAMQEDIVTLKNDHLVVCFPAHIIYTILTFQNRTRKLKS
jgi:hypothetical protein